MSTNTVNKKIVRRIFDDVWNQANYNAAGEIFAKPEGVKEYIRNFLAAFPDLQHEVTEIIAEDGKVVASWTAHGSHAGVFHNILPTNREVAFTGITIAQIENGKITQHHTQWDTRALLEALGVVPIIRKIDGSRL